MYTKFEIHGFKCYLKTEAGCRASCQITMLYSELISYNVTDISDSIKVYINAFADRG